MYKCVRNGGLRYLNGILGAVAANLEKELKGVETVYSVARRISKRYSLGEYVVLGGEVSDDVLLSAVSICRRRFKEEDIILMNVLDDEQQGEIGIVLTEEGCFVWNEKFLFNFNYKDIESVDYNDEDMEVYVKANDEDYTIELSGDEDEHYPRKWYNLLLDIKEIYKGE